MNLINALQQNSLIENTKGGLYHHSSYDANLNLYAGISRFNSSESITIAFSKAYNENRILALANLLFILDVREGKGERRVFKIIFKFLCNLNGNDARIILSYISSLGRYDYILEGLGTSIENDVITLIKNTIDNDLSSEHPSLLAKWLPSHRTHGVNSQIAKYLMKKLGMSEKEYRQTLSKLRTKINIVEKNLTNQTYDNIKFEEVPTKAMLKYSNVFYNEIHDKFVEYKQSLVRGESKINTNGLFCYEIIKRCYLNNTDVDILDAMWKNQKQIDTGNNNILVVADTSGSMTNYDFIPLAASLGLALYTAERNKGIFKDKFITFSSRPIFQDIKGESIIKKLRCVKSYIENTNIDKVFELILKSMKDSNSTQKDLPSHIIIISDMEFDEGVYSNGGTNFEGWKKAFKEEGYTLPKIVFWNVAGNTCGFPVTKNNNDVVMVSGFSTNLIENIFKLEEFDPISLMIESLNKYIGLIEKH